MPIIPDYRGSRARRCPQRVGGTLKCDVTLETPYVLPWPNSTQEIIKIVAQYHENEDILGMWGPDAAPLPPNVALRWFSIAVAGFVSFGFLAKYALVADRPAIPREYPFSGLVTELGGLEENQASVLRSDDHQNFDIQSPYTFSRHRLDRKVLMTRDLYTADTPCQQCN